MAMGTSIKKRISRSKQPTSIWRHSHLSTPHLRQTCHFSPFFSFIISSVYSLSSLYATSIRWSEFQVHVWQKLLSPNWHTINRIGLDLFAVCTTSGVNPKKNVVSLCAFGWAISFLGRERKTYRLCHKQESFHQQCIQLPMSICVCDNVACEQNLIYVRLYTFH